jgi:hypothetical protein
VEHVDAARLVAFATSLITVALAGESHTSDADSGVF